MKAINTETGEVIAEDLTSAEIDKLVAAGADAVTQDAPDGGGSSSGDGGNPDAIAEEDGSTAGPENPDISKVDDHGEDETHADDAAEMEEDLDRSAKDWAGVEPDTDVDTTTLDLEQRFEQLQREQEVEESDLAEDKQKRDERIETGPVEPDDDYYSEVGHNAVRDHLRETGMAEEIIEAFSQFKTADRWIQGDDGDRLNEDAVVDLVAGDSSATDRLYERKQKSEPGDRVVGVSCDMSGSMDGVVKEAKSAMGALALACDEIGDDFIANSWTSTAKRGKENQRITLVTGPDEEFEWEQLDSMWPQYQDPITPGMRQAKQYMDDVSAGEQLLVVITDGAPQMMADGTYNAREAIEEARQEVERYRQEEGYVVIGLGIQPGVDDQNMSEMFGERGYVLTGNDTLVDDLVAIYEDQMRVGGGR